MKKSRETANHKAASITTLPGPKRTFLLGNIPNFPLTGWSAKFTEMRETMGDVLYINLLGHLLVLHSLEDAEELLVKRANVWSGRIDHYVLNHLMKFGWSILQIQPGHDFYEMRKIFRKVIGPQSVNDYNRLIESEAENFVRGLKGFSGDPTSAVIQAVGGVIIKLAYGEKIFEEHGAELVKLNTESIELMTYSFQHQWLVNYIQITQYLPSWVPGIQFHKYVARGQELFTSIRNVGFNLVKADVDKGDADFSVISKYLNETDTPVEYLRDAVAMMYMAGVDTTSSALLNFISIMILYPDVQKTIQKEIDGIAGQGASLTTAEIQTLTFLKATWRESLRFHPPAPTGVPHFTTEDSVWKGISIPKNTVIMPNIGFMLRDPRIWGDDANEFKPERFLSEHNHRAKDLPDVESIPFGFGRRICPGRYIADRNGIVFVAALLQNYDILPEEGASLPVHVEYDDGLLCKPKNMKCRFVPRR
ncbi:cytochrome P450 [Serendipita vermifera]|nr:cytochrome P450 [Serendipita vermifera]